MSEFLLLPLKEKYRVNRRYKGGTYQSRDVSNGPIRTKKYSKRSSKLGPKRRAYGPPWSTAEELRRVAKAGKGGKK